VEFCNGETEIYAVLYLETIVYSQQKIKGI